MSFLSDLTRRAQDQAKRVRSQLNVVDGGKSYGNPTGLPANRIAPQALQQIQHAKYGVLAHNPNLQQSFINSHQSGNFSHLRAIPSTAVQSVAPALKGFGMGVGRSTIGLGQAGSGLVDLASPGLGTNRVSKLLDRGAKSLDATAVRQGINPAYKVGQLTGDTAQFLTPGVLAKGASKIPGVAKLGEGLSKTRLVAGAAGKVADTAANLANKGLPGRLAAAGLRGGASGTNLINAATGTISDIGQESSKGRAITPARIAGDTVANLAFGTALPVAGQLAKEVIPGARAGLRAAGQVASSLHSAKVGAADRVATRNGVLSEMRKLDKDTAQAQRQLQKLAPNNFRGAEALSRKADFNEGRKQQLMASLTPQNPLQKFGDRVLSATPGLGMKAVHSSDLSPEQNDFVEQYAEMLKDLGQGNGVGMVGNAQNGYKRVSNNVRDADVKGKQLTNSYWFDKARKEIESGKAAYGASDDYKALQSTTGAAAKEVPPAPIREQVASTQKQQPGQPVQSDESLPHATTQPGTTDTKLNTDRLNTSDEGKAVLDKETQTTIDQLSNESVQEYAKNAGIDTKTHTAEQTREIIAKQLNVRQDAVKRLAEAKAATNPREKADLIKKAAELGRTSREQGTDIARQLQARKIIANELDSPEQRLFKLLDNAGVNPDVYSKKLAEIDMTDPKAVVNAYREMVPAKFGSWLDTLRYNSMLSSPLTQVVNAFGNAQGILTAGVEKNLRGTIDSIGGLFGKEREFATGEGTAYLKGSAKAIGEASNNFIDALRGTGKYANNDLEEYSIPLATKGIPGAVYKGLSAPMRVLDGMDKFFRTLAEAGEESSLTHRESKGIAVKGNREAIKKGEADYRVFQTELGTPGQGMLDQTFDEFAKGIMHFRNSKNPIISTISKFTIPFVKTVNNINKQGVVDYSPLGLFNLKGNADKTTAITRAVMGSAVFGASAALLGAGQMTWAEPRNADERAQFRADGKQAYAVRVGDKWVNFSKLHPSVAFPMAMTAAIDDALKAKKTDQSTVDSILEAVSKYGNFLSDQSYAKSIGDTLGAVGGDKEAVAKMVSNNVQQVVPYRALSGWIARISDSTERKVDTSKGYIAQQVESLMQQYPWLRQKTTTRDNAGVPIAANNQVLNGFSPVKITDDRTGGNYTAGGAATDTSTTGGSSGSSGTNTTTQKQDLRKQIEGAFTTPEGRKFMALSDADKKAAAQTDPNTRALYDQYQAVKTGLTPSTTLRPVGLSEESTKTLNKYDRLTPKGKDTVLSRTKNAEYQYEKAKFESDKLDGKLSTTEEITRKQQLDKMQVGSEFDKSVRDIYGLNKTQIFKYITENPDGKKIANQLIAYGDSLESNDLGDNKFRDKYGNVAIAPKDKTASSKGSKGSTSTASTNNIGSRSSLARAMAASGKGIKARKVSLSGKIASSKNKQYKAPNLYKKAKA